MAWLNFIVIIYLIIVNITAAFMTVYDKKAARKHKRRIPEKELMLIAFLGGGIGMYLTMRKIKHKTQRRKFMVGIPVIVIAETVCFIVLIFFFHGGYRI